MSLGSVNGDKGHAHVFGKLGLFVFFRLLCCSACWLAPFSSDAHGETIPSYPLRQITLLSGEQFVGEWLSGDSRTLTFGYRNQRELTVDRQLVERVENPAGIVDLDQRIEERILPDGPWVWMFPEDVSAGVCELWIEPPADDGLLRSVNLQILDSADVDFRWTIQFPLSGILDVTFDKERGVSYRQRLKWPEERVPLLLVWDQGHWTIALGEQILARGQSQPFRIRQIQIASASEIRLDRGFLRQWRASEAPVFAGPFPQDALLLNDGSVMFGQYSGHSADGIEWQAMHQTVVTIPWSEYRAVQFRSRNLTKSLSPLGQSVRGKVQEWRGIEQSFPYSFPPEKWIAAELAEGEIQHPFLGALPPEVSQGSRSHSWFQGTLHWLSPESVHLGDEIHDKWPMPRPSGPRLFGTWNWAEVPTGEVWLAGDFSDLEPCGERTPPDERYLAELQRDELTTSLWVNGHRVGTWNREVKWRAPIDNPQRLRLRVPNSVLKSGQNTWEVLQQSLKASHQFDDVLIRRLALEIVETPSP